MTKRNNQKLFQHLLVPRLLHSYSPIRIVIEVTYSSDVAFFVLSLVEADLADCFITATKMSAELFYINEW